MDQLHVLPHEGASVGVDGQPICPIHHPVQVRLCRRLQGLQRVSPPPEVRLDFLLHFTNQSANKVSFKEPAAFFDLFSMQSMG